MFWLPNLEESVIDILATFQCTHKMNDVLHDFLAMFNQTFSENYNH